jgi:ribosomal protein S18 acetylase RimI-like enzyme
MTSVPLSEQSDPAAGERLTAALPRDTFAQVCGRGGLVLEVRVGAGAALWRGHPWGTGWTGGGEPLALGELVEAVRPTDLNVPAGSGLPTGYSPAWGWGWHAATAPPPVYPGEASVGWLADDAELRELVARAFPDAETPPGDPRVARWFGARIDGRLIAAAAALRTEPGAAVLSSLTVDPQARRSGWGGAVTAWFARERLSHGAGVVGLGTYLANTAARALYTRVGFVDVPYVGGSRDDQGASRNDQGLGRVDQGAD